MSPTHVGDQGFLGTGAEHPSPHLCRSTSWHAPFLIIFLAQNLEVLRPFNLKKQAIIEVALNEKNVEDDLNLVWSRTQSDLYQVQLFPD